MHVHARLRAASLSLIVLMGCAIPLRENPAGAAADCAVGSVCTVEGEIFIYRSSPASVAEIRTANGCVAAALDDRFYRDYRQWNGRRVLASGTAYRQAYATDVVSYEINGRVVATGICPSGPLLFVDTLRLR